MKKDLRFLLESTECIDSLCMHCLVSVMRLWTVIQIFTCKSCITYREIQKLISYLFVILFIFLIPKYISEEYNHFRFLNLRNTVHWGMTFGISTTGIKNQTKLFRQKKSLSSFLPCKKNVVVYNWREMFDTAKHLWNRIQNGEGGEKGREGGKVGDRFSSREERV